MNRGNAWRSKQEYDRAIADCTEAIRLDPKLAVAYNNRGFAWNEQEEYDRAIADYDEAIRLDPKYAAAYSNRGFAWHDKGEHDRAIADYTEAIRLDPKLAVGYNNRGSAWRRQGRIRPGHRRLRPRRSGSTPSMPPPTPIAASPGRTRGITTGPSPTTPRRSGSTPRTPPPTAIVASPGTSKSEYDRAIADSTEAIRLDPKHAIAYNNRGNAWYFKGEFDRAIADCYEAIKLSCPHSQPLQHDRRDPGHVARSQVSRRAKRYRICQGTADLSGWSDHVHLSTLAAAHAEAGEFEAAVQFQEKALNLADDASRGNYIIRIKLLRANQPLRMTARSPAAPATR